MFRAGTALETLSPGGSRPPGSRPWVGAGSGHLPQSWCKFSGQGRGTRAALPSRARRPEQPRLVPRMFQCFPGHSWSVQPSPQYATVFITSERNPLPSPLHSGACTHRPTEGFIPWACLGAGIARCAALGAYLPSLNILVSCFLQARACVLLSFLSGVRRSPPHSLPHSPPHGPTVTYLFVCGPTLGRSHSVASVGGAAVWGPCPGQALLRTGPRLRPCAPHTSPSRPAPATQKPLGASR